MPIVSKTGDSRPFLQEAWELDSGHPARPARRNLATETLRLRSTQWRGAVLSAGVLPVPCVLCACAALPDVSLATARGGRYCAIGGCACGSYHLSGTSARSLLLGGPARRSPELAPRPVYQLFVLHAGVPLSLLPVFIPTLRYVALDQVRNDCSRSLPICKVV